MPIEAPIGNYNAESEDGLACAAADDCFTAYSTQDEQGQRDGDYSGAYIQHWDGSRFSLVDSNVPATSQLEGIDCPGPQSCFVAGAGFTTTARPLIDHWDGTGWAAMPVPHPTGDAWLLDVSCASTSNCVAVGGHRTSGSAYHAFAERWDGQSWRITPIPHPAGQSADELLAVDCPTTRQCLAVGQLNETNRKLRAFSELRNGTKWHLVAVPRPHPRTELHAINCPSPTLCYAVGDYWPFTAGRAYGLIDKWNGTSWSQATSTNAVPSGIHVLNDIDCTSKALCATVGWTRNKSGQAVGATAIWNGTTWRTTSLAKPRQAETLFAVGCWRRIRCLTVGDQWTNAQETQLKPVADTITLG